MKYKTAGNDKDGLRSLARQPRLNSPVKWFGGKGRLRAKLLPLIPLHHIYCEPCGGGASLLLSKPASAVEVYNDIDSGLVNFFRMLRDHNKFRRLRFRLALTPYSRQEWKDAKGSWKECADDVERAYKWFLVVTGSFSGEFGKSWKFAVQTSRRGVAKTISGYLRSIAELELVHTRLMMVQIDNKDVEEAIKTYDSGETFFYIDPPYVSSTRRGGGYEYEMSDEDHHQLVERLLHIQGKVLLSGYRNEIYEPLERAGWRTLDFLRMCYAVGRTRSCKTTGKGSVSAYQRRTETVWLNYEPPGGATFLFS